jgi:hypothetical protein
MHSHLETLIPKDAKVSASSPLVPHLAMRDIIYQFPYVADADYIALMYDCSGYPLLQNEYSKVLNDIKSDSTKTLIFDDGALALYKVK